jgi:hypothetical protein
MLVARLSSSVTRLQTRSCYETTADHVVGNVVGGLNLIRILRIDDEIVESRKSRARARIRVDESIRADRFGIYHSHSSRSVLDLRVSENVSDGLKRGGS